MGPKRILFVSHSAELAGSERSLLELIQGIDRDRFTPLVILPYHGDLTAKLQAIEVPTTLVPHVRWFHDKGPSLLSPQRYLSTGFRIALNAVCATLTAARFRNRVDAVYTNTSTRPLGGAISKRLAIPNVWHIRESVDDLGWKFDLGGERVYRFIEANSRTIICNSQYIKMQLQPKLPERDLQVVYNGPVSRDEIQDPSTYHQADPKICFAGALTPNKGVEDVIRVAAALKAGGINVPVSICGSGERNYQVFLHRLASRLDVADQIDWLGKVDDVMAIMRKHPFAIVPSRAESFGRVAIEAMASGCLTFATRVGGIPEIIHHTENGFLYQPGNIDMLARQIKSACLEQIPTSKIRQRAFLTIAKKFSREAYVQSMNSVFESLFAR